MPGEEKQIQAALKEKQRQKTVRDYTKNVDIRFQEWRHGDHSSPYW